MASDGSGQANKATFSFSIKKKEKQKITTSVIAESTVNDGDRKDFILDIQENKIKSTEQKEEKKELVIPLITKNRWHGKEGENDSPPRKKAKAPTTKQPVIGKTGSKLEDEALKELMKESARYNDSWEGRDKEDTSFSIPLLMVNKPPEGFETDDKLDVSIRPNQADEADYDQVPIESFGKAMLRGMGWKEKEGIGNKMKKVVAPIEAVSRPKGQGLGADLGPKKPKGSKSSNAKVTEETELGFVKGAGVLITKGPHKNLYGMIEGVDEDNARLMIKLALGGQMVTISQFNAKAVPKSEYKKYAKDLGKFSRGHDELKKKKDREDDQPQEDTEKRRNGDQSDSHKQKSHDRSHDRSHDHRPSKNRDEDRLSGDHESGSDSRSHKERHKEGRRPGTEDGDRDSERSYEKKRRREEKDGNDHRKSKYDRSQRSKESSPKTTYWLRQDLRVRFIDKSYKSGKFYNSKVQVIDVQERDVCSCRTDDGKLLADIHQDRLETLIPKGESGYVMVVHGKQKGQVGTILSKDKKRCEADVQMLRDRDQIVRLGYDSICEYVGDTRLAEDL